MDASFAFTPPGCDGNRRATSSGGITCLSIALKWLRPAVLLLATNSGMNLSFTNSPIVIGPESRGMASSHGTGSTTLWDFATCTFSPPASDSHLGWLFETSAPFVGNPSLLRTTTRAFRRRVPIGARVDRSCSNGKSPRVELDRYIAISAVPAVGASSVIPLCRSPFVTEGPLQSLQTSRANSRRRESVVCPKVKNNGQMDRSKCNQVRKRNG